MATRSDLEKSWQAATDEELAAAVGRTAMERIRSVMGLEHSRLRHFRTKGGDVA